MEGQNRVSGGFRILGGGFAMGSGGRKSPSGVQGRNPGRGSKLKRFIKLYVNFGLFEHDV